MSGHRNRHVNSLGKTELPIGYVVCNFWPPSEDQPSLLDFTDLTTLYHEFGHVLQQTLSNRGCRCRLGYFGSGMGRGGAPQPIYGKLVL